VLRKQILRKHVVKLVVDIIHFVNLSIQQNVIGEIGGEEVLRKQQMLRKQHVTVKPVVEKAVNIIHYVKTTKKKYQGQNFLNTSTKNLC